MTTGLAIELLRKAVQLSLLVSAPMLITALVVGLLVSLFQAVTQLQEQTLTFIPKLVLLAAVVVLALPWILGQLVQYLTTILQTLPTLAS
jgi:flagellar biosynthetic protein FliQ